MRDRRYDDVFNFLVIVLLVIVILILDTRIDKLEDNCTCTQVERVEEVEDND